MFVPKIGFLAVPPVSSYGGETSLLLHFDAPAETSLFIDSSANNLNATAVNGATTSSANSKFGNSSLYCNGGYARINNANSLVLNDTNWTIECFFNIPLLNNPNTDGHVVFAHRNSDSDCSGVLCSVSKSGMVGFFVANTSGSWQIVYHSTNLIVTEGAWHHLALVKQGQTISTYLDGVAGLPVNVYQTIGATGPFNIGCGSDKVNYAGIYGIQDFLGYIDEFRIVKGEAVYTSNFTPPSLPFGAVESLLLHFDGADASTTFTDSSPM